jgi:prevent-host-death family protein
MTVVTANDLKTKGIADIERALQDAQEVVISVRGKPRYVVMDIAHYDYLRECEIAAAWAQTREDVGAGRYRSESADAHLARIRDEAAAADASVEADADAGVDEL